MTWPFKYSMILSSRRRVLRTNLCGRRRTNAECESLVSISDGCWRALADAGLAVFKTVCGFGNPGASRARLLIMGPARFAFDNYLVSQSLTCSVPRVCWHYATTLHGVHLWGATRSSTSSRPNSESRTESVSMVIVGLERRDLRRSSPERTPAKTRFARCTK